MEQDEEKIYFTPGMRVKCKQVSNAPEMYVIRKKSLTFKDQDNKEKILQGMVCRWFTDDGLMQEAVFNTKDIIKL